MKVLLFFDTFFTAGWRIFSQISGVKDPDLKDIIVLRSSLCRAAHVLLCTSIQSRKHESGVQIARPESRDYRARTPQHPQSSQSSRLIPFTFHRLRITSNRHACVIDSCLFPGQPPLLRCFACLQLLIVFLMDMSHCTSSPYFRLRERTSFLSLSKLPSPLHKVLYLCPTSVKHNHLKRS